MSRFLQSLRSGQVLLMDGAMGTELQRAGIGAGECYELWNLTRPDVVRGIHQAYVAAGAECLLTHTFQANPVALARHGCVEHLDAIQRAALDLARAAAGPERFILYDIGPVGSEEAANAALVERLLPDLPRVDAILLETFSDPLVFFLARQCQIVAWNEPLPVLVSLTYQRDAQGRLCTWSGQPPEWFALQARQYDIAALGVNCGKDIAMPDIIEIIRRYRQVTDLPLFARPNAGAPTRHDDRWHYPSTPEQLANHLPSLLEAGVSMVGGCCGATPAHIAAFQRVIAEWNTRRVRNGSVS
ncbi:MAG: homocysteine S-methyltransferase family protein [Gemmataceae bacterium]